MPTYIHGYMDTYIHTSIHVYAIRISRGGSAGVVSRLYKPDQESAAVSQTAWYPRPHGIPDRMVSHMRQSAGPASRVPRHCYWLSTPAMTSTRVPARLYTTSCCSHRHAASQQRLKRSRAGPVPCGGRTRHGHSVQNVASASCLVAQLHEIILRLRAARNPA
jgi:hypothetical protein